MEKFPLHINALDRLNRFTHENAKYSCIPFLEFGENQVKVNAKNCVQKSGREIEKNMVLHYGSTVPEKLRRMKRRSTEREAYQFS